MSTRPSPTHFHCQTRIPTCYESSRHGSPRFVMLLSLRLLPLSQVPAIFSKLCYQNTLDNTSSSLARTFALNLYSPSKRYTKPHARTDNIWNNFLCLHLYFVQTSAWSPAIVIKDCCVPCQPLQSDAGLYYLRVNHGHLGNHYSLVLSFNRIWS
jgi:hypothetical protein